MKNKRWKRKAKRLKGKSDILGNECYFCNLVGTECYCACTIQIRKLENLLKGVNLNDTNN